MSESAVATPPPEAPVLSVPDGGFTFSGDIVDLVASVNHKGKPKVSVTASPAEAVTPVPAATEPEKKEAPAAEIKTPETPAAPSSKEENLANLRKLVGEEKSNREKLQAELEALRKQHEDYKTRVPETAAEEAKRLKEQFETERKLREDYENELKASSYERSPEYKTNYVKPVQDGMKSMVDLAVEAGVDPAQAQAGINSWDKTKFSEWYGQMDPFQQSQFSTAMHLVQAKYKEGQEAIRQASSNWEKIQQEKQQAAERQKEQSLSSYRQLAETTVSQFVTNEAIKEAPEVQEMIRKGVQKVADQQFTPQELMQQAAALPIFHHMAQQHLKTIEAHEAKLAEQAKKIEEQDAWIKAQTGGQPFPGNGTAAATEVKPLAQLPWEGVRVAV